MRSSSAVPAAYSTMERTKSPTVALELVRRGGVRADGRVQLIAVRGVVAQHRLDVVLGDVEVARGRGGVLPLRAPRPENVDELQARAPREHGDALPVRGGHEADAG